MKNASIISNQSLSLALTLGLLSACSASEVAELGVYEQRADAVRSFEDASGPVPSVRAQQPVVVYENEVVKKECFHLSAHAPNSEAPYSVPANSEQFVRFTFHAPFHGKQYIRSIEPQLENPRVVHHWTLYAEPSAVPDAVTTSSTGAQPGAKLIYGWTPGAQKLSLPNQLGIPVDGDLSYTLEIRYFNQGQPETFDATGVELCGSVQPPDYTVALTQQIEL
jgi:hypothetical protein